MDRSLLSIRIGWPRLRFLLKSVPLPVEHHPDVVEDVVAEVTPSRLLADS